MTEPYAKWWHDSTEGIGLSTVLDARTVCRTTTPHHQIEVLAHENLGWVLAIDGVLQGVELEPGYREMRIHVPLLGKARNQCRLLLLGGGDGALLHEILRHSFVSQVVLCEPDSALIRVGAEYLGFGSDLHDPRVEIREQTPDQALGYARTHDAPFDVIVPAWPGNHRPRSSVISQGFCEDLASCLSEDGVCVDSDWLVLSEGGTRWYRDAAGAGASLLTAVQSGPHFGNVEQYRAVSPLSPGGFIGFFLYTHNRTSHAQPRHDFNGVFYNPRLHEAAFALPSLREYPNGNMDNTTNPGAWWHEQTYGIGITQALNMKRLHAATSAFQEIEVYEHRTYGRVLVLDGTVQLSVSDEFIYHEMAVHIPLMGRPKQDVKVLIIGGGDGGILREALKHSFVSSVVMVEIDPLVVGISNQYVGIQGDYSDPRVDLRFEDGVAFMARAAAAGERFDLIVVDATDSTSPSKTLWSERFYENLSACLADDGVCVDSDILTAGKGQPHLSREPCDVSVFDIVQSSKYFSRVESYFTKVPLYPGGYFAFFLYTKDGHSHSAYRQATPGPSYRGRFYNEELHSAAFALPTWWQELIG